MTLEEIDRWVLTTEQMSTTESALREAGAEGFELFVLWTGVVDLNQFRVRHVHVPKQTSYQEEEGLHVRVDGSELHKLNVWLYENGESLGAQVHTHPGRAYHSDTDDSFPMVTTLGGLSIVVADFCSGGLLDTKTAMYRLGRDGWTRVARRQAARLITQDLHGSS